MKKLLALIASLSFVASIHAADFPNITIDQLKSAMNSQKVVLLDANGTDSWQNGHIPGAIDYSAVQDNLSTVLPSDKQVLVVAYCGNPHCPAYHAAAVAAKKLGYTNVKHLTAGIQGWREAGEKTEKGGS